MTLPCLSLAEFTEQALGGAGRGVGVWKKKIPSADRPPTLSPHWRQSTWVHIPDKGGKAQSLLIKSTLFALIERSLWNKGSVFVWAKLPLLIDLPELPLGQAAALPDSLALLCHQLTIGWTLVKCRGTQGHESLSLPGHGKAEPDCGSIVPGSLKRYPTQVFWQIPDPYQNIRKDSKGLWLSEK